MRQTEAREIDELAQEMGNGKELEITLDMTINGGLGLAMVLDGEQ